MSEWMSFFFTSPLDLGLLKYLAEGVGAFLAVYGSTFMMGARKRIAFYNALIGFLSWDTYTLFFDLGWSNFSATLMGAMVVGLAAQIGARYYRTPVTMIIIPTLYPLVPGALLFRAVNAFLLEQKNIAANTAIQTIIVASAIALGLLLVETGDTLLRQIYKDWKHRRKR